MTFRWRTFGFAFAALTILMVSAWSSLYPPFYLTNDDVTIRRALEGQTAPGQPPTGFALMTHAALGWALVALGRLLPIPWWDVVLAGVLVWALAVLVALVWSALGSGWLARSTVAGALLVAMAPLVASIQFTISATLAGGAAALLVVMEMRSSRPRRGVLAMAIVLCLVGLLLRPMGGPAGAVLGAALSMPLVRPWRRSVALTIGLIGTVAVLFFAAQYVDGLLYGVSHEWKQYYRFNWIVGPLLEWGGDLSDAYSTQIRESVGWSANDWRMLTHNLGVDPVLHGYDRVNQAYRAQMAVVEQVGPLAWVLARGANAPAERLWELLSETGLLVIAGGALVAGYGTRRAVPTALTLLLIYGGFCLAVDTVFDRLPWRLVAPLQVILVAATLLSIGTMRRATSPWLCVLALGGLVALVAPVLAASAEEAMARQRASRELADSVLPQLQRLSPSLVIDIGGTFPRERWYRPFHRAPTEPPVILLGWNNQNPQVHRYLTEHGRQPLLRALCTTPSILIVAQRPSLELITEYLREHFDLSVEWAQVYAGSFPAWSCSTVDHVVPESR